MYNIMGSSLPGTILVIVAVNDLYIFLWVGYLTKKKILQKTGEVTFVLQ